MANKILFVGIVGAVLSLYGARAATPTIATEEFVRSAIGSANAYTDVNKFSGNYNDLTNRPTLGTAAAQNIAAFATAAQGALADTALQPGDALATESDPTVPAWAKSATKPTYTAADVGARAGTWVPAWGDVTGKPTFATVATSGSYADLSNKPTIPAAQVNSDWNATTGSAQILNKPTIPTVGTAVNNVPKVGTALGTTANNIVATNAAGALIPTGVLSTNVVTTTGTHTITGTLNVPTPTLP